MNEEVTLLEGKVAPKYNSRFCSFSFRRDNLMQVTTAAGVEAVLADLSSLPVIPLVMLALEERRGKSSG